MLRHMIVVGFMVLSISLLSSCAYFKAVSGPNSEANTTFTWEGELDPNDFDNWETDSTLQGPVYGLMWVIIKNPDLKSPIEKVALLLDVEASVFAYRYFKHGRAYMFLYDDEKDRYITYEFNEEERNSCMECHDGARQQST